jgi:hypothetical protein
VSIRIPVTLVVEMDDDQLREYLADAEVPAAPSGHVRARDIVKDVREYTLAAVANSGAFMGGRADVSIKGH